MSGKLNGDAPASGKTQASSLESLSTVGRFQKVEEVFAGKITADYAEVAAYVKSDAFKQLSTMDAGAGYALLLASAQTEGNLDAAISEFPQSKRIVEQVLGILRMDFPLLKACLTGKKVDLVSRQKEQERWDAERVAREAKYAEMRAKRLELQKNPEALIGRVLTVQGFPPSPYGSGRLTSEDVDDVKIIAKELGMVGSYVDHGYASAHMSISKEQFDLRPQADRNGTYYFKIKGTEGQAKALASALIDRFSGRMDARYFVPEVDDVDLE